jgi:hypothetical protein
MPDPERRAFFTHTAMAASLSFDRSHRRLRLCEPAFGEDVQ